MVAMNAVIDIGNTRCKLGLFSNASEEIDAYFFETSKVYEFLKNKKIKHVLICNVSNAGNLLEEINSIADKVTVLTKDTPMPITTDYKTPETLGVDRLAACLGGRKYYEGNVLVIDAGSCITYDLLTDHNVHKGGVITPGLLMRLKAMHTFTSNLPLVPLEFVPLEGKTTFQCLQSGATNGTLLEMKGIIETYKAKYDNLSVIIGGGDADFFDKNLELNTFVVSNLVLEGLRAILIYNE